MSSPREDLFQVAASFERVQGVRKLISLRGKRHRKIPDVVHCSIRRPFQYGIFTRRQRVRLEPIDTSPAVKFDGDFIVTVQLAFIAADFGANQEEPRLPSVAGTIV